ncbi:hypothetical protein ACE01N_00520 [Saccharicrinis sp. FJH2]|uniref:hypothetical protein n=1 Tax=Saccharicrinis sp. FJH65 TaxID=3344659 RepID=UPI0035F36C37
MNKLFIILTITVSIFLFTRVNAQDSEKTFEFRGQAISWLHYNPSNEESLLIGGRYLPQINYRLNLKNNRLLDLEVSGNMFGSASIDPFTDAETDGKIKPYRAWIRYSTPQLEIRAGLQKINFGSATMLRPLMWFDQIDPRDPLKLTDGVWGVLGRYYFLNNANIWLWGLAGNKNPKGWEQAQTNTRYPELGGRFQFPVLSGESGITYHHRFASTANLTDYNLPVFTKIPENRFGFDLRMDYVIGFWVEGSWINKQADLGWLKNQEVFNAGADYTFGIGSGLYAAFEQLVFSFDEKAFAMNQTATFSLLSLSYPIGIFDQISAIMYYDWNNDNAYNFINYQRQFNKLTLYVMAYWNPENFNVPLQGGTTNIFGGKGIQLMLVFNH